MCTSKCIYDFCKLTKEFTKFTKLVTFICFSAEQVGYTEESYRLYTFPTKPK